MTMLRDLPNEIYRRTYDFICRCFSNKLLLERKSVDEVIKEKINNLKRYKFAFNTKIQVGDNKDNVYIDPATELTADQIKEKLLFLRNQHIEFYKDLLDEYLKNQQEYDEKIELKYFHPIK